MDKKSNKSINQSIDNLRMKHNSYKKRVQMLHNKMTHNKTRVYNGLLIQHIKRTNTI